MRITMESKSQELRDSLYHQALERERAAKYREALLLYERSLKIDPEFSEAWLNSGALFSRLKNRDKAIYCFTKVLSLGEDPRGRYNLALEHYKAERYEEALEVLDENSGPRSLSISLLYAYCYGKTGRYSRSESILQGIMKDDPGNKAACIALVLLYGKMGERTECMRYQKVLAKLDPHNPLLEREEIIFQREEDETTSQILDFRKRAQSTFFEMTQSLEAPQQRMLLQDIEQKSRQIASRKEKSKRDYFDLSLLSMLRGEGEEAMDFLLSATHS